MKRRFKQRDERRMHDTIYAAYDRAEHSLSYLVLAENHFHSRWNHFFVSILIGILSCTLVGLHFLCDNESLKMKKERLGTTYIL
jgi:hypothetical protein